MPHQPNQKNESPEGQSGTFRKDVAQQDNRLKEGNRENREDASNKYKQNEAEMEIGEREEESRNDMPPAQARNRDAS